MPVPAAGAPAGIALVPFDHDRAAACRDLLNRAYADGMGDVVAFETWWAALVADSEYDPALCFVAEADGKVVGFCQCWTSGFIRDLAVDAGSRQRGLGGFLLATALNAFVARGIARVDLKTDIDNLTAQALYRRFGFVVAAA